MKRYSEALNSLQIVLNFCKGRVSEGLGGIWKEMSVLQEKQEPTVQDLFVDFANRRGVFNCLYILDIFIVRGGRTLQQY